MDSTLRMLAVVAVAATALVAQTSSDRVVGFQDRYAELAWLYRPPVDGERCVQFSSYDRRSDAGDADAAKWYANNDRGNYLRVIERDGKTEHVMVDVAGPGCLARLWSANPKGMLFFDVDGQRIWSVDFAELCRGGLAAAPEPLAGMYARGGNLYLPVTFQDHLRVSSDQGDLYYLADIALLPPGEEVAKFSVEVAAAEALARTLTRGRGGTRIGVTKRATDVQCSTKSGAAPAQVDAGRVLESFSVEVRCPSGQAEALGEVLRNVVLAIRCGKEETVRVPLCDFFAGGTGWTAWSGYLMGIEPDGGAYCHWPMPMPSGGQVELRVVGPMRGVEVSLSGHTKPLDQGLGEPLLFRANYHQVKQQATRPFSDHVVLAASGRGRFVGCSLLVRNPSRIWWGEGDEKFYVDGEAFPSWFGTGTEDYFGYAWCDPTPFAAPLHAQVQCDGPMNFGFTQLHRSHMLDCVPFQESFRFDLERWHWVPDIKVDYATVAYWYGAAGATSGLPELPAPEDRQPKPLPVIEQFVATGAVEGESLEVLSCSGGTHEVQDLTIFERVFSRDAHRWWRDGEVGDALVLGLPVAAAGRYKVTLAMVRADDFGVVQVSINNKNLGAPFDGFARRVSSSGPFVAGVIDLALGVHDLRLELVGKNQDAKERMMVGLDYVVLEKL